MHAELVCFIPKNRITVSVVLAKTGPLGALVERCLL